MRVKARTLEYDTRPEINASRSTGRCRSCDATLTLSLAVGRLIPQCCTNQFTQLTHPNNAPPPCASNSPSHANHSASARSRWRCASTSIDANSVLENNETSSNADSNAVAKQHLSLTC